MTTVYQNIDASIFIVIKEEEFIMTLLKMSHKLVIHYFIFNEMKLKCCTLDSNLDCIIFVSGIEM